MSQKERTNLYKPAGESTEDGYSGTLNYSSIRLLELPPTLLEIVESFPPGEFTIKPSPNGTAILSTETKSFLLREVDQSNSLLLFAPTETDGFRLVHTAKQYFESVTNPNRITLDDILPEWNDGGMDIDGLNKITLRQLRRRIAASHEEIDQALYAAHAVEIDGYVYQMSPAYVSHLLDLIVLTATADSLPLNNLGVGEIMRSLSPEDEKPECIQAVLKSFSDVPIERISPSTQPLIEAYSLSQEKVTRWYGLRTLSNITGGIQPTTSFLKDWKSALPIGIDKVEPHLTLLRGNYHHPTPTQIQYLPASGLSKNAEDRFAQLFGIKDRWGLEEIMPFLEGCVENGEGWEKKAERECHKWARVRGGMVMDKHSY